MKPFDECLKAGETKINRRDKNHSKIVQMCAWRVALVHLYVFRPSMPSKTHPMRPGQQTFVWGLNSAAGYIDQAIIEQK